MSDNHEVKIFGSGFISGTQCWIDDEAVATTFLSETEIVCQLPVAYNTTSLHVCVTNYDIYFCESFATFEYKAHPMVLSINPLYVSLASNITAIDLFGYNFHNAGFHYCMFNGNGVENFARAQYMTSTHYRCLIPELPDGEYVVELSNNRDTTQGTYRGKYF